MDKSVENYECKQSVTGMGTMTAATAVMLKYPKSLEHLMDVGASGDEQSVESRIGRVGGLLDLYEEPEDVDQIVTRINRELYGTEDYQSYEYQLQQQFGKGGACSATWDSPTIAFECSDCERAKSAIICADCFFKSNHEGHVYSLIKSAPGCCCDCGNPNAWDPQGYCTDHKGVLDHMDGQASMNELPQKLRVVAAQLILSAIHLLEVEVDRCHDLCSKQSGDLAPKFAQKFTGNELQGTLKRSLTRIVALLKWTEHVSSLAFGFRYMVNQCLSDKFMKFVIHRQVDFPVMVQKAFYDFFLSLLVSPNFSRRFAKLLVDDYVHALSGRFDMTDLDEDSSTYKNSWALCCLSRQLFPVPELAMACCWEWNLLPILCEFLKSLLPMSSETETVTFQNYDTLKFVCEMLDNLKAVLRPTSVVEYLTDQPRSTYPTEYSQAANALTIDSSSSASTSLDALVGLLAKLHHMNLQKRYTKNHIEIEDKTYLFSNLVENRIRKALSVVGKYCKQPLPLHRVIGFYSKLADAVRRLPYRPDNLHDHSSFHVPLPRFFVSVVDKHLIFRLMESKSPLTLEEEKLLEIFDYALAKKLLDCGLSCLLFASAIDQNYWVRNGSSMKKQRKVYPVNKLASIDLEMVQLAVIIIGYLERRKRQQQKRDESLANCQMDSENIDSASEQRQDRNGSTIMEGPERTIQMEEASIKTKQASIELGQASVEIRQKSTAVEKSKDDKYLVFAIADNASSDGLKQQWQLDPFCQIVSDVFRITGAASPIHSVGDIWEVTRHVLMSEGQEDHDKETEQMSDRFRINFIFELLGRIVNQLFSMEASSLPRRILPSDYVTRGSCIIRRETIQRLAEQRLLEEHCMTFLALKKLMKRWRRHPNFEEIVEDVADKRTVVGTGSTQTSTILRLRPDSWRLVDVFWPVMSLKDMQQTEVR